MKYREDFVLQGLIGLQLIDFQTVFLRQLEANRPSVTLVLVYGTQPICNLYSFLLRQLHVFFQPISDPLL